MRYETLHYYGYCGLRSCRSGAITARPIGVDRYGEWDPYSTLGERHCLSNCDHTSGYDLARTLKVNNIALRGAESPGSQPVLGRGLTTASSARVNHKVPSSSMGARGAHAER